MGVNTLALASGLVYAGGTFSNIGGQARNKIAALDASTGLATAWNPNPNAGSTVLALAVSAGNVYGGGNFTNIGGQARQYLAALDASTGLGTAWNPFSSGLINTILIDNNRVYAGGTGQLLVVEK